MQLRQKELKTTTLHQTRLFAYNGATQENILKGSLWPKDIGCNPVTLSTVNPSDNNNIPASIWEIFLAYASLQP